MWVTPVAATLGYERLRHTGRSGGASHVGQCLYLPTSSPMTPPMVVPLSCGSCEVIPEQPLKPSKHGGHNGTEYVSLQGIDDLELVHNRSLM